MAALVNIPTAAATFTLEALQWGHRSKLAGSVTPGRCKVNCPISWIAVRGLDGHESVF